jgi:flagellar protein FliO/FliZ
VGLLVQIPIFSQESTADADVINETVQEDAVAAEDPYRAGEQSMTFEDTPTLPTLNIRTSNNQGSVWVVIRMVLVLALAAAAIYGIVFLIKRASKQNTASDPFLKILASSHLGFNRYVHIASVGSKAWLLGSSEGGVNLISEIDDKEVIDALLLEDSGKAAGAQSRFPDFLTLLRKFGAPAQTRSSGGIDEIRRRRERLKGM